MDPDKNLNTANLRYNTPRNNFKYRIASNCNYCIDKEYAHLFRGFIRIRITPLKYHPTRTKKPATLCE